jgi:hypothetical protein
VAWRETTKKSLGTFRYLFRVLVVLELPLLFVLQSLHVTSPGGPDVARISNLLYGLWCLGAAMIVVHAGSVIAAERTRQTLDVLLASPLTGAEILRQKLRGVDRLIHVLLVPFLTIFVFEWWWYQTTVYRWLYLALALVSVAVYLPLVAWLALWIGLKVRSQIKAVLATTALVAFWLLMPAVVRTLLDDMTGIGVPAGVELLLAFSPAEQIPAIEGLNRAALLARKDAEAGQLLAFLGTLLANFAVHALLWRLVRHNCLRNADRLLGRLEAPANHIPAPVAVTAWE